MGKDWDSDKGGRDAWIAWLTEVMRECYRVLKPGAHGLVWALPRTSHWTATALENAGFEVRDVVTHLFGHPTVKPLSLMRYLCRLVTPPSGVVLDPFAGSGSTAVAARLERFGFIGFEREPEYVHIAEARIAAHEVSA